LNNGASSTSWHGSSNLECMRHICEGCLNSEFRVLVAFDEAACEQLGGQIGWDHRQHDAIPVKRVFVAPFPRSLGLSGRMFGIGTKQTLQFAAWMSASGGKADIPRKPRYVRF
jgi:hypothetical protein